MSGLYSKRRSGCCFLVSPTACMTATAPSHAGFAPALPEDMTTGNSKSAR